MKKGGSMRSEIRMRSKIRGGGYKVERRQKKDENEKNEKKIIGGMK